MRSRLRLSLAFALLTCASARARAGDPIFVDGVETGDTRLWSGASSACGSACPSPVEDGCGPFELCDNGLDDDCNGTVEDGCPCTPGAVQSCFQGVPGRRNIGTCFDGAQTCFGAAEFGVWGVCEGGIVASTELLDGQDNDCNGCVDDAPRRCNTELACPGSATIADGHPFDVYAVDGAAIYPDTAQWQWTVSGGPCDQLFVAQGIAPSFTVTGANGPSFTLRPTLSGDYAVHLELTLPGGAQDSCDFVVHVAGPGIRIESCSDDSATSDLDQHLHRPGTTSPWFTTLPNNSEINNDDCYYINCSAIAANPVDWGYAPSPLAECVNGPDGALWQALGYCRNPRLEVQSISQASVPEVTSVDVPENGGNYRVMVHYYAGTGAVHPMVNVYCGGVLEGSYGRAPDLVPGFDLAGGFGAGDMWRVVDVVPVVTGGVTTSCTLYPLHAPGQTSGYWVTTNDRNY
jgi:hypothetical protein